MAVASETRTIKLKVADFGPIGQGSIELRPMSVFVGPSNTGKSYLAILIYALHQFFGAFAWTARERRLFGDMRSRTFPFLISTDRMQLSNEDIDELYSWAESERSRIDHSRHFGTAPPDSDLSPEVCEIVRRALNEVSSLDDFLSEEIIRCFGFETTANAVRISPNSADLNVMKAEILNELRDNEAYRYKVEIDQERTSLSPTIPSFVPFTISDNFSSPWFSLPSNDVGRNRDRNARVHVAALASAALSASVGPLGRPAHYLPADRAGVMHAHQVAIRGLIAGASRAVLRSTPPMPVLSGVLGDFLDQVISLGTPHNTRGFNEGEGLAQLLESRLMDGSVRAQRSEIDYPSFVYRPNDWRYDIPLMNCSSMVSELAPVVLYLRHVVRPGDTLIIEEPESHLHPTSQVEFTRMLVAAVTAGVRIIITTHSEWVLWELANLMRMAELPPELRSGIEGADHTIHTGDVGAWLFDPQGEGRGSVVREIKLDIESGTIPAGYGLTSESLYSRWATIDRRVKKM